MLMLSSEQLSVIQGAGALVFLFCLGAGGLYLVLGLIRPSWVWREKRRWVVLTSLGLWLVGIGTYVGVIAFTHAHPNGPHSFTRYFENYIAEQCAAGADLPGCKDRAPPAGSSESAPATQPAP
jgi:hypothetical protein